MTNRENALKKALREGFPKKKTIQDKIFNHLSKEGYLPSGVVEKEILKPLKINIEELMILLLPAAEIYARVPISSFHVGAVALGNRYASSSESPLSPDNIYLGSNIEFEKEALSFCVHAEQSAVNNAWLNGETGLQALAISAAPCGYCRQFLYELTSGKNLKILLKKGKNPSDSSYKKPIRPLQYYLQDAFGGDGHLMESECSHNLTVSKDREDWDWELIKAAFKAAKRSYSPYTSGCSGVALRAYKNSVPEKSKIYSGRYAENAAYNPSMSPMESALAFMYMSFPDDFTVTDAASFDYESQ